jgi:hypothetical protein
MNPLTFLGFLFLGVGAVALSMLNVDPAAGAITCMAWGIVFVIIGSASIR